MSADKVSNRILLRERCPSIESWFAFLVFPCLSHWSVLMRAVLNALISESIIKNIKGGRHCMLWLIVHSDVLPGRWLNIRTYAAKTYRLKDGGKRNSGLCRRWKANYGSSQCWMRNACVRCISLLQARPVRRENGRYGFYRKVKMLSSWYFKRIYKGFTVFVIRRLNIMFWIIIQTSAIFKVVSIE